MSYAEIDLATVPAAPPAAKNARATSSRRDTARLPSCSARVPSFGTRCHASQRNRDPNRSPRQARRLRVRRRAELHRSEEDTMSAVTRMPRSPSRARDVRPHMSNVMALAVLTIVAGSGCTRAEPAAAVPPEVLVTEVVQKDVPIYTEWVGTTVGFVNAQIMPRVQGYLLKQDYEDGAHVKADQLLFEIDDRPYKAALDQTLGDLAQQQATLRKHQLDVTRFTPLVAQGAVSKQELDDAVQATHASDAQVRAAEAAVENARLNLGWTKIYSPIDGIAGIAPVQVGDLVTPSSVLTTVSRVDPMKVTFAISEREYLRYADGFNDHHAKRLGPDEADLQLILADG